MIKGINMTSNEITISLNNSDKIISVALNEDHSTYTVIYQSMVAGHKVEIIGRKVEIDWGQLSYRFYPEQDHSLWTMTVLERGENYSE